jgi:cytoskeletal protein CcmA (bactofilin family)
MDIIDRSINGVGAITLSGTTHTLTTTDGTLSDGMYKVLVLGGSPSGTNTITISPNDQDKVYIVVNGSGQTATFTQGSGGNVSVLNGDSKIIYADGAGSGAAVVDVTADLSFSSVNIDGGTIDGTVIGGASAAAGTFTTVTASGEIDGASLDISGNADIDGTLETDALSIASTTVTSTAAELNYNDTGAAVGTVVASKTVTADANKDVASFRNITLTGELDAGSLDISGDADIDGTLEADAMTLNGVSITATATLSTGISNTNVPVFTTGVADDDFLRVAGTSIEGRSAAEVLSDIGGQASLTFGISNTNAVKIDSASVADDEYARFTANGLESRSTAEVLSDIGGQASLTFGISNTNAVKIDSASVADDEYARFTANGLESRSTSEVLSDIGGQASLTFGISNTNAVKIDSASVADDEYARFTASGLESRSTAEVLSDIGASPVAGSGSIVTTGALDAGSITSGFGAIDNGSSTITTSGVITGGSLLVADAGTIGSASDTDAVAISSAGQVSFSATNAIKVPVGTTAQRPSNAAGLIRYNSTLGQFEGYTSAWGGLGGGATGGGADQVFVENSDDVTTNYTITSGKNAMSVGPITVESGVVVTIPSGSRWVVL